MTIKTNKIFLYILFFCGIFLVSAQEKPRVFVLTDIENEPDDAMSMVRFLVYANNYDIEGLAATTSVHQQHEVATYRIKEIVEAYSKVRDNLEKHEPGFPTGDYLKSIITEGLPEYGVKAVGEGKDSPASELLIQSIDKNDTRPLWVTVWGGPNVLAQALWKVKQTRSAKEVDKFISKIRVYTISDQDDSGPWIRKEFPNLFYIVSPGFNAGGGYHHATWSGISGDFFHARCDGGDFTIVSNEWLEKNIRKKGPLGAEYPHWDFLMEGDTPSFLSLINNGLNDPEHPEYGGWGGRYELYTPRYRKWQLYPESRPIYSDAEDEVLGIDSRWHLGNHETIWRWREAFQNDFAARMDWTINTFDKANHPPIVKIGHDINLTTKIGDRVNLSAKGSTDPDGDALSYKWFYYKEAGTFSVSSARSGQPVEIQNNDQQNAWFAVPTKRLGGDGTGTMHIILAVTDHGSPRLTRYQRVIVTIEK
ncbi:nucleoside hydrolase-like domain-containing protein [Thalassobellus sediminis]|uniref:nucleoside hydrolase-like domain-containing protein n=1 Tax=Thalassobellus sediminis TaxID=3367753 RepID=UPI00378D0EA4